MRLLAKSLEARYHWLRDVPHALGQCDVAARRSIPAVTNRLCTSATLVILCTLGHIGWAQANTADKRQDGETPTVEQAPSGEADSNTQPSVERFLPTLGNTRAQDRVMLREVGDTHVFEGTHAETPISGASPHRSTSELAGIASPAHANIWERLRSEASFPAAPQHERISHYREQYRQDAVWISRIFARGKPYLGHIVDALDKRYMPVELALLPAIESGYRPLAHSKRFALGLWQLVPATAAEVGVDTNVWFDGRADVVHSTRAALDYLSYLNAVFNGDWFLTLAAYNAGPGRVNAAIRRNREAGKPTDYWSLPLPRETRNYVPKFVALIDMIKDQQNTLFDYPAIADQGGFTTLTSDSQISIDQVAAMIHIDAKALRELNAGWMQGVTAPAGPHRFYLPNEAVPAYQQALTQLGRTGPGGLTQEHRVQPGDTLSGISLAYGLSERRLMEINHLDSSLIQVGQRLRVLNVVSDDGQRIPYIVNIGDTLSEIALQHAVDEDAITFESGAAVGDTLHPGDTLLISFN